MGAPFALMQDKMDSLLAGQQAVGKAAIGLVAPFSSMEMEESSWEERGMVLEEVYRYGRHLNLDDLDFAVEGVWATLRRVVGRRGLAVWRVSRMTDQEQAGAGIVHGDW